MSSVLVMATIAKMKHYNLSNFVEKGYIWIKFPHLSQSLKEVRTGTQKETEYVCMQELAYAESVEECCFLACFPWLAPPAFL